MERTISQVICKNPELVKLYQNNCTFNKAIHLAISNKMDIESAMIFALIEGYKLKDSYYEANVKANVNSYNSHF